MSTPSPVAAACCAALVLAAGCSEDPPPPAEPSLAPSDGSTLFVGERRTLKESINDNIQRRDPGVDQWRTEVLHEAAKPVLAGFLDAVLHEGGAGEVEPHVTADFRVLGKLRPDAQEVFRDGRVRVARGSAAAAEEASDEGDLGAGLREAFGAEHPHPHFKIQSVDLNEDGFDSSVLVFVDAERLQINAEWLVGWTATEDEDPTVRVRSIRVPRHEEVAISGPLFGERTTHLFRDVEAFDAEFLHGIEHYRNRVDSLIGAPFLGMQGICVADVNGDGRDDLFVPQQAGLPNRLLLQREDGTLEDATRSSRLGILENTRSALLVDWDDDGDQDLIAGMGTALFTLRNDGSGRFKKPGIWRTSSPGEIYSLSAADADGDGDLDVYCSRYAESGILHGVPTPYHDANNGAKNVFFENRDGKFVDATERFGFDDNNRKYSLASLWDDFDGDGDLDLYVANDFGRNNLYTNEDGRFRDVAVEVGADDLSAGMGITASDTDCDGDVDLYVTNMFSSAGLRIVPQTEKFMGGTNQQVHAEYERHARGNSLLANNGDGTFTDVTVPAAVSVGGWAWGAKFIDLNNDGYEDIYSPNGFVTNPETDDL